MYDISLLFLLAVVVSNRATYKQLLLVLVPLHTAYLSEMSAIKSMNTSYFLQISSHVKAIDAIYQGTDFMGIRNISFMVKRIRVSLLQIGCFCILGLFTVFPVNQLSPVFADKHHQWWEGQVQPIPLCQHWCGEVFGAELGAEPRRLLLGLCFHWQRFWRWGAGFGLGGSALRYANLILVISKQSVSCFYRKVQKHHFFHIP